MIDGFVKGLDLLAWLGFGRGVKPRAVRNPDGYTKTTGPYGEVVDCDTLRCAHCSGHFEVVAGSGRLRGFCRSCMGYVCGAPACMACCVPNEQRLDNIERGVDPLTPRPEMSIPTGKGVLLRPKPE